jgi:hypothetical protein
MEMETKDERTQYSSWDRCFAEWAVVFRTQWRATRDRRHFGFTAAGYFRLDGIHLSKS